MKRLNKLIGKKYRYQNKTYTIGFKIFTDIKYKCITIHLGVHWIQNTSLGKNYRFNERFYGHGYNYNLKVAIDNLFKDIETDENFGTCNLKKQINKLKRKNEQ